VPCVKLIQGCAELWITSSCARSGGRWRSSPSPRLGRSSVPRAERKSRTRWPGLPTELEEEPEETKGFDLLMFNLELSMLRTEPAYVRLQNQVREIAELLEEKDAIPILRVQMDLIQDIQADDWGRMRRFRCSSRARRRLRDLVRLIDKQKRKPAFTDFEDLLGGENVIVLPPLADATNDAKFYAKALPFLRARPRTMSRFRSGGETSL
jgi:type I site-specific restriction endonuclease